MCPWCNIVSDISTKTRLVTLTSDQQYLKLKTEEQYRKEAREMSIDRLPSYEARRTRELELPMIDRVNKSITMTAHLPKKKKSKKKKKKKKEKKK